jgi:hypothetical protein
MNSNQFMKWAGTVIFLSFAIFNLIDLLFLMDRFEFGPDVAGQYSIYSSQKFFIAYHIWGIAMAIVCTYAMWKEVKILFLISLMLLMLLMFYPYFTGSPMDQKQAKDQINKAKLDSLKVDTAD